MIQRANHSEKRVLIGNELETIERGEFISSEPKLADEFRWSRTKLRAFLRLLQDDDMLALKPDNKKTRFILTHYCNYQDQETTEKHQKNINETSKKHQQDTNKNDKELKRNNNTPTFDDFWKIYPNRNGRKVGKQATMKLFKNLKSEDIPTLMSAVKNYSDSPDVMRNFAKDPERFLQNNYWRDFIEKPESSRMAI